MIKLVICKIQVKGFHQWREAFDDVDYLRNRHRHVFEIEVRFRVERNDRQIEIIDTQNKIEEYLLNKYSINNAIECEFGNMSCEDIAEDIMKMFDAYSVTVTEDGFGGAKIINTED